jgi:hypothetical protein
METVVAWIAGIIASASVLANLTSSNKDNELLAKLDKFIQMLALNIRKDK